MGKFIDKLIIPFIISLIAGGVLYWYQFDKPDVRYSLSEKLPVSFSSKVNENIQLLEVKNVGKSEATGIVVKSTVPITYELQKNTNLDKVEVSREGEPFELKYPALPPGAAFKIILKTSGSWLTDSDLLISHSKGKASNAFHSNNGWVYLAIYIGILSLFFLMLTLSSINFAVQRWESKITYNQDAIIKRVKKPFYIGNDKWNTIRRDAWEHKLIDDVTHSNDPQLSASFRLLNTERPSYFDKDDWDKLISKANDIFFHIITLSANNYFSIRMQNILSIDRPNHLNDVKWNDIKDVLTARLTDFLWRSEYKPVQYFTDLYLEIDSYKISDHYKLVYKRVVADLLYNKYLSELDISKSPYKYIQSVPFDIIDDKSKLKLTDKAYRLQYERVTDMLNFFSDQLKILNDPDFLILKDKDKLKIKNIIYENELLKYFPIASYEAAKELVESPASEWIEDSDYRRLYAIAKDIVSVSEDRVVYNEKLLALNYLAKLAPLGDNKPSNITDDDWNILKNLEEQLYRSLKKCETTKRRILKLKNEYESKHEKINYKLHVLDKLLADPAYIDKIEDINDLFSSGNLANLRGLLKT